MRICAASLAFGLAAGASLHAQDVNFAPGPNATKLAEYQKKLPATPPPVFDEAKRELLAGEAISCADRPQEAPSNRNNYLWQYEKPAQLLEGYDRNRVFFGCGNWHDAVGQVWMLMSLLRQDPRIAVSADIKDIATTHFRKSNIDGEYAFVTMPPPPGAGRAAFEMPYGYAWVLKLYGETKGYNNADGRKMSAALAPLAKWMSEKYVFYLYNLKYPYRTGVETNTAWSMAVALDGANLAEDTTLKTAIQATALRLFAGDKDCPTVLEPQNADLISSCLTEASLIGRVMEPAAYLKWLDAFLPPVYAEGFQVYAKDIDISHLNTSGADAQVQQTAAAHKIALLFQRAADLLTIGYALPKDDPRVPVLRELAAINAQHAYEKFGAAGYEGQHLLPYYALLYENEAKGPALLGPEKPKQRADETGGEGK